MVDIPSLDQYYRDLTRCLKIATFGPLKTFSYKRLKLLEAKFNLHVLLNEDAEFAAAKVLCYYFQLTQTESTSP